MSVSLLARTPSVAVDADCSACCASRCSNRRMWQSPALLSAGIWQAVLVVGPLEQQPGIRGELLHHVQREDGLLAADLLRVETTTAGRRSISARPYDSAFPKNRASSARAVEAAKQHRQQQTRCSAGCDAYAAGVSVLCNQRQTRIIPRHAASDYRSCGEWISLLTPPGNVIDYSRFQHLGTRCKSVAVPTCNRRGEFSLAHAGHCRDPSRWEGF